MKRKMEQERIPSWNRSTAAQWAAIQEHSLTLAPITSAGGGRAALWQTNTVQGERFTECLDFLLKNMAKKHSKMWEGKSCTVPPAAPTPVSPTPLVTDGRNDGKLLQTVYNKLQ